ncbi:MAG: hypothetical protein EZS28_054045, partial [Streblomastix strix]
MAKLFVLLQRSGPGFIVTDDAKQMLLSVPNAVMVIFTSPIRSGKSTCINYLVTGDTTSYYIDHPMKVKGGIQSVTKDFNTYGPVPLSTLNTNFGIANIPGISANANIFFVDSEGTGDLRQPKQDVIMGIMSLLPVACVCVYISSGQIQEYTMPEIASTFKLSNLLSSLSNGLNMTSGFAIMSRNVGYQTMPDRVQLKDYEA